ncbi:TniB family NTP-binding protein [Ralstonia solanacearum]|uniref:TniB family NTP-binding protein n=1 Tax=Ralstonia solanacearum TaxID=305 RepID=UPI003CC635EA
MSMAQTTTRDAITRAIRRSFGRFHHVKTIFSELERRFRYDCTDEEAEHLLIVGEAGVGKSTLLRRFRDLHPPVVRDEYTEVPVLYVALDSACSIKKLARALLLELGSKYWDKGDESQLTYQLICLLRGCRVRLVILDEVNHLVDKGGEKTHHNIADWIKRLSDATHLPFVLAGIPRAERLLDTNDQLRSRFRQVISIQPFSMEDKDRESEFRSVLLSFQRLLGEIPSVDLSHRTIARAFVFATGGRLREIRKLLIRAVELAFERPSPQLTAADLSRAFETVIYRDAADARNPFSKRFSGTPLTRPGEPFAPIGR